MQSQGSVGWYERKTTKSWGRQFNRLPNEFCFAALRTSRLSAEAIKNANTTIIKRKCLLTNLWIMSYFIVLRVRQLLSGGCPVIFGSSIFGSLEIELTEANADQIHTVSSIESENVLYILLIRRVWTRGTQAGCRNPPLPPICPRPPPFPPSVRVQLSLYPIPAVESIGMVHGATWTNYKLSLVDRYSTARTFEQTGFF